MTSESLKFYDKYIALRVPTTLIYSTLLILCTDMLPTDRRKAPPKPRQRGVVGVPDVRVEVHGGDANWARGMR